MYDRPVILALRRRIMAMLSTRQRARLYTFAERIFNAGPDSLFMSSRRRYGQQLQTRDSADPPALLRLAAFRRRIPASVETFEVLGRPDIRMVGVESIGTQVVFWTGYEWAARHGAGLEIWERLCERSAKIAEFGANVGFYAIAGGSAARGSYTTYEPHPHSCSALRQNLALNELHHVEVVEAAAVPPPAPATADLLCPTGTDHVTPSGATVRGSSFDTAGALRDSATVVVRAVPFDTAVDGADLVKIDVEGLEAQLLWSAMEQLRASKPLVMVEIHDANTDLRALVPRLMEDLDATAYAMHSDHLVPVTRDTLERGQLRHTCNTWDFLLVPSERASIVDGLVRVSEL